MDISGSKTGGIFIGIDFGDIERSMRSREELKNRAMESHADGGASQKEDPNFRANRLINTLQEKGTVLDVYV